MSILNKEIKIVSAAEEALDYDIETMLEYAQAWDYIYFVFLEKEYKGDTSSNSSYNDNRKMKNLIKQELKNMSFVRKRNKYTELVETYGKYEGNKKDISKRLNEAYK
jgi:hypothetical protein